MTTESTVTTGPTIFDMFEDRTDINAYSEGRWFPITAGSRIKLRSATSAKAQEARREVNRPYALRTDKGLTLTDEENKEIFLRIMAKGIIVDWEGPIFVDEDRNPLPYTADNAYAILSNPKLTKFSAFLMSIVMDEESFNEQLDDASEKN